MVFLSAVRNGRWFNYTPKAYPTPAPGRFWRKQMYFRFAWRFRGRKRNCYSICVRFVNKALMLGTIARPAKRQAMKQLWNYRLGAACYEHGLGREVFTEGLARSNIQLDKKVLTDLAIYEPRTFQSLTEIAKQQMEAHGCKDFFIKKADRDIKQGIL